MKHSPYIERILSTEESKIQNYKVTLERPVSTGGRILYTYVAMCGSYYSFNINRNIMVLLNISLQHILSYQQGDVYHNRIKKYGWNFFNK